MQRNQATLTLSVPPGTKERLAALAERLNLRWGEQPSPSKLVAAIADGSVPVGTSAGLTSTQVNALLAAVARLLDAGEVAQARDLAELITRQGHPDGPQLAELYGQLSRGELPFRATIEDAIARRCPVLFQYGSQKGTPSQYLARHLKLTIRDRRWYVDIYTEDRPSGDVGPLRHNRCLRLDRITSAVAVMHAEPWQPELAHLEATLRFLGDDARFYEAHPDDTAIGEVIEAAEAVYRIVSRRVYFSWWFTREVLRHGAACRVEGPAELVEAVGHQLKTAAALYP